MIVTTTRTNPHARCPACQSTVDAATSTNGAKPKPGDISACCYCTALLSFNTDLTLRLLRQDEFDLLPAMTRMHLRAYSVLIPRVRR